MDAKESIKIIRDAAEYAKKQGLELVRINDLENLINEIEKEIISGEAQVAPTPPGEIALAQFKAQHESSLTHYKAQHESNLAQYKATMDNRLELFRSVIQAGQAALRSAILINGGGAFALLAFLGHIWNTHPTSNAISGLSCSLMAFAFGVLVAAMASGTTYLAQFSWGHAWKNTGNFINIISIILVIASYILFALGCYASYNVFGSHFKPI